MAKDPLKNIALLIDADNASHVGIDPVLTVLAELGQVNIRRAYGNWAKPQLASWNKHTHRYGLQPVQRDQVMPFQCFQRLAQPARGCGKRQVGRPPAGRVRLRAGAQQQNRGSKQDSDELTHDLLS